MPGYTYKGKKLDARPDRLDLRDREYRPPLRSLPPEWPSKELIKILLPCYKESGMILNQGKEGACTGFGLAAVINYLLWREAIDFKNLEKACLDDVKKNRVSPRMLYNMARIYDEWAGEDYEGSSCRGAMKGWHRHGVCREITWEYTSTENTPSKEHWAKEAIKNPLGAYYRINKDSVVDMQGAIKEVGAIYCSAEVHEGWWIEQSDTLPTIKFYPQSQGGHAFAVVGYNADGFIVQNSWGEEWGYQGFAVLTYKDWVQNGRDSWVAVRGAPVNIASSPHTFTNHSLQSIAADFTQRGNGIMTSSLNYAYDKPEIRPWHDEEAYCHSLVISNDGRPKHTMIAAENGEKSANIICFDKIKKWLQESSANNKIVIYGHGGLNSEKDSIDRVRIMAPYFKANGIYPLFITWKTGFIETIGHQIKDKVKSIFSSAGIDPASSFADKIKKSLADRLDLKIEKFAREIVVRGVWSEMKENAKFASDRAVPGFPQHGNPKPGGMVVLAKALEALKKEYDFELHLVGHSAGSILFGHWMDELIKRSLSIDSLTLYAPACTVEFANRHYIKACEHNIFSKEKMFVHMMDDERELADNVAIYHKSLLYLVSRALEDIHKMPLLGMAAAWDLDTITQKDGKFNSVQYPEIKKWIHFAKQGDQAVNCFYHDKAKSKVQTSQKGDYTDLAHGSFDNDIAVIEQTIKQIKGANNLVFGVENLNGF